MYIRKECRVIANSASGYWFCSGSAISCILMSARSRMVTVGCRLDGYVGIGGLQ